MTEYPEKIREDIIDGCGPWFWPADDHGAWDGPVRDWKSHKETISYLKTRRTVVQAGGCCGLYPVLLSKMFENVLTFEPDETNRHFLLKNTNNIMNVYVRRFALGNEQKNISMNNSSRDNVGTHSVNVSLPGDVTMVRFDDEFFGFDDVDLIWFDIEGYELEAIKGSIETIKKNLPMIGLERPSSGVEELLFSLGYEKHSPSEMDVFYIHKDKRND